MEPEIWPAEPQEEGIAGEMMAGAAGLGVVAIAMLFLLDLALGWHLAS
ncbi:hypothetical protein [Thermaurantiacus sp.]